MNSLFALLLLAFASISIQAQHPPKSTAESRRKVEGDPDALFRQIASKDAVEAKDALTQLGLSWLAGRIPEDVRLAAVNLDNDEDLERVLIVRDGLNSAATVLKREGGAWWNLGSFHCCLGTQILDPFIELKDIVWYGTKDIIVHQVGSHGTGVGEVRLFIYRVLKGQLYKILDIVESSYDFAGSEWTRITYPSFDSRDRSRVLVVHRVREEGKRRSETCEPYRWDSPRFTFSRISATKALCGL